jgi:hypothetical protein
MRMGALALPLALGWAKNALARVIRRREETRRAQGWLLGRSLLRDLRLGATAGC